MIAILGLLMAVAVPVYLSISANINQSMYETKIEELKAKSEKYSEETGKNVFDVKTLIEDGVLSPDTELGDYKDPVTNRDMSCDIITMEYQNSSYEADITESDKCYEGDYLENLYGMAELYIENASGEEIRDSNDWLKENQVNLRYRLKPEYQGKGIISEVSWSGQAPVHCNSSEINTEKCQKYLIEAYENGIKNVEVRLQIKIILSDNGASFVNNLSKKVLLDIQRPKAVEGSIQLNNEVNTSGARRVAFELTDGAGSGVKEYAFTTQFRANECALVTGYKNGTDGVQVEYLMSGTYGICVRDKVGNVTNDEDLAKSKFEVKEVDVAPPAISFTGSAIDGNNGWKKSLTIKATTRDNEGVRSAKYCITTSNTCVPDVDATLSSGTTTREFSVVIDNHKDAQTLCGQVTDLAGNMSEIKCSIPYYVDGKLPSQSFAVGNYTKGSGEWYKSLQINVTGADEHSGIVNGRYCITTGSTCNPNQGFNGSATTVTMGYSKDSQKVCANFTDKAGNTSTTTCMNSTYKIDGEKPGQSFSIGTNTPGTNGWYKKLTIEITGSDSHSGVANGQYCVGIGTTCNPNTSVSGATKSVTLENNASSQYVCASFTDKAGNTSTTTCAGPYYVDGALPTLSSVSHNVNGHTMTVYANANDTHSKGLTYYYKIRNGGWVTGGSSYTFYNVSSGNYSVDVYVVDRAGNRSTGTKNTTYVECQNVNQIKIIPNSNYGSCTKACGGGTQYRDYHMDDKNSEKVCRYGQDSRSCNTMDCCSRTERSGEGSWSSCSAKCDGGTQYRDVYYRSYYDHSVSCGTHRNEDSRSCNTTSCCSSTTLDHQTNNKNSVCPSCGSGTYTRTEYYRSSIDSNVSCGSRDFTENCNTPDCCSDTYTTTGDWSSCSKDCGGGYQSRTIYYYSRFNNQSCGTSSESQRCNTGSCCSCTSKCPPSCYGFGTDCVWECTPSGCDSKDGTVSRYNYC